jgi:hypothetical protein
MEKTKLAVYSGIAFMLVLAAFAAGCTTTSLTMPGISGTYVNQKSPSESIEIHSDGTFYYMTSKSTGNHGTWEMNGDTIRLNVDQLGLTIQLEHKDNTLVMQDPYSGRGKVVFVKQ